MNNYLSPAELLASYSAAGVRKMERSAASLLLLGALAGAIIAIAAAATNTAVYGISDTWTVRTICGLLFPFGLGLVVVTGAELFQAGGGGAGGKADVTLGEQAAHGGGGDGVDVFLRGQDAGHRLGVQMGRQGAE